MGKVLAIGLKDVRVVLRDRPALAVLLGMPAVLILILSAALSGISGGGFNGVKAIVVDQDRSEISRQISDALLDQDKLGKLLDAEAMTSAEEARRQVRMGERAAVLVIPKGFGARLNAGEQGTLQVEIDPGQETAGGIFRSVVEALTQRVSAAAVTAETSSKLIADSKMAASQAEAHRYIGAAVSAAVDDELDSVRVEHAVSEQKEETFTAVDYFGAGMAVMFLNFGAMFGAFALVRERTEQTLARLLSAPVSRAQVLGGKALGVFAIGMLQFTALVAFGIAVGAHWGPLPAVYAVAAAQIVAVAGLSVLIAALGKTQRGAGAIGPLIVLLMAAAGGSWIPVSQMPPAVQPIHLFTVNGWSLDAMLRLQAGGSFASVLPNIAALLAIGAVLFGLGLWRLRWEA